jgi:hypothetical protein
LTVVSAPATLAAAAADVARTGVRHGMVAPVQAPGIFENLFTASGIAPSATIELMAATAPADYQARAPHAPDGFPVPPAAPTTGGVAASAFTSGASTDFWIALLSVFGLVAVARYRRLLLSPAGSRPVLFISLLERPG